jgi:hypothetical protein
MEGTRAHSLGDAESVAYSPNMKPSIHTFWEQDNAPILLQSRKRGAEKPIHNRSRCHPCSWLVSQPTYRQKLRCYITTQSEKEVRGTHRHEKSLWPTKLVKALQQQHSTQQLFTICCIRACGGCKRPHLEQTLSSSQHVAFVRAVGVSVLTWNRPWCLRRWHVIDALPHHQSDQ